MDIHCNFFSSNINSNKSNFNNGRLACAYMGFYESRSWDKGMDAGCDLRGDPRKRNREMEKVRQMRGIILYGFQDQADNCCRHLSSTYNSPNTGPGNGTGRLGIYPITPTPIDWGFSINEWLHISRLYLHVFRWPCAFGKSGNRDIAQLEVGYCQRCMELSTTSDD